MKNVKSKVNKQAAIKSRRSRSNRLTKKKRASRSMKLRLARGSRGRSLRIRRRGLKGKLLLRKKKRLGKRRIKLYVKRKGARHAGLARAVTPPNNEGHQPAPVGEHHAGGAPTEGPIPGPAAVPLPEAPIVIPAGGHEAGERQIHVPHIQLPEVEFYTTVPGYIQSATDVAVTVVIPTLNAGPEFRQLLQMLIKQKPFRRIEIVVIDSGSKDETLKLAGEYQAKVIQISQEQFSHSFVRNLGADHSSSDCEYLLFMTQYALPPSEHWIYQMYAAAVTYGASAVSCGETMKESADLYYRIISWSHSNYMGISNEDKLMRLPEDRTYDNLRKNAQLMNIGCLIRKDVFMNYKFQLEYAEDIHLGLRLIEDGHTLALLGKSRLIHSHNRSAHYYLKRGYLNSLALRSLFKEFPLPEPLKSRELAGQTVRSYGVLTALVHEVYNMLDPYCSPTDLLNETVAFLDRAIADNQAHFDIYNHRYVDDKFFSHVMSNKGKASVRHDLLYAIKDFVYMMCDYLQQVYERINPDVLEDVKGCLFKSLADRTGCFLASNYVGSQRYWSSDLNKRIREVSRGVKM